MPDTAVVEKKSTAVANVMDDLYASAGEGLENVGAEDMQIPFLRILQPLSPQLNKQDSKYIKGASGGDLFNTVTGQFWDSEEGVSVIPCAYQMKYLEFQLRENGGGFMGELDPNSPDIRSTERNGANEMLPSGNELVRSAQFLVLAFGDDGIPQQMICDMKKTQMKIAKQWNTRRAGMKLVHPEKGLFTPPMWATVWKLTSVQESNDKGSWFNYQIAQGDVKEVSSDILVQARDLYNQFKKGEIKTAAGTAEEMNQSASDEGDEIPF
tara:strand:- start:1658 stop:2458 length:801 start_codon:yes stop_codon:yes gene_type:complete